MKIVDSSVELIWPEYDVPEHAAVSARIVCDRGVSHELMRQSTRYCNYADDQFGREITVITPTGLDPEQYAAWRAAVVWAELSYLKLLDLGATPQVARAVLPNSLRTEVFLTATVREWRHILRLRTAKQAHPDMRRVMRMALNAFRAKYPGLFEDLVLA